MFKISFETLKVVTNNNQTIAIVRADVYRNGTYFNSFTSKGSTICRQNDVFDEKTGQRIAIRKAKKQAFANISNAVLPIYKQCKNFKSDLEDLYVRCLKFRREIDDELKNNR